MSEADKGSGFSLVEVLLAIALLAILVTTFVGALVYGQQAVALAGTRARAVLLLDEGVEAVRNIRNANFANLTAGTKGLAITNNRWVFSGSSDTTDIFTRQVVVSSIDPNRRRVTVTVQWQQTPQRVGVVQALTYFTNWR